MGQPPGPGRLGLDPSIGAGLTQGIMRCTRPDPLSLTAEMDLSYFSDRILRSTNGKFDKFVWLPENRQSLGQAEFLSEDVRWVRMFRNTSAWVGQATPLTKERGAGRRLHLNPAVC